MKPDFQETLTAWLERAQKIINDNHTRMEYKYSKPAQLSVDPNGKKYIRIVSTTDGGSRSVHCFIDAATGDVLKAASWKAPAKHARGNIYEPGREGVGPYGANYLR